MDSSSTGAEPSHLADEGEPSSVVIGGDRRTNDDPTLVSVDSPTPADYGPAESLASSAQSGHWQVARTLLKNLYGSSPGFADWVAALRSKVVTAAAAHKSILPVGWERDPSRVGYSAYIDRFGGTFRGVAAKSPYLHDLGIGYFHPLPFSRARAGENDGGFAVADYLDVDPRLGTTVDLEQMIDVMGRDGIAVVVDVVCNHTSDDHAWALAAKAGNSYFQSFYHVLRDTAAVDAFEATVPDVFPQSAPGNFTWVDELQAWVWSTFYPYQWDLNYGNPAVFEAMLDVLLGQIARGVLGFRLDSTLFLWKELGTSCRGLPQAHRVVQAWRALVSMVAPEVVFKAEAIDRIEDVLPFFGEEERAKECQLSYNNTVMTSLWAALATGDCDVVAQAMAKASQRPSQGTWVNYVRCHDDVIWSALAGLLQPQEIVFLTDFYTGAKSGSFAVGAVFQQWADVGSVNGTTASLVGARGDGRGAAEGVQRLLLLHGVCMALDGLPIIYMGDEIGLENDEKWREASCQESDGRWLHRPVMDWSAAGRRQEPGTREHYIFHNIARLIRLRRSIAAFRDLSPARFVSTDTQGVAAFSRGLRDEFVCIANFSGMEATVRPPLGTESGVWTHVPTGQAFTGQLDPWACLWLELRP